MKNINILNNLNSGKTSSYFTTNGTKEFTCNNAGYVDNVAIEGKTLVNLASCDMGIRSLTESSGNIWTTSPQYGTFTNSNGLITFTTANESWIDFGSIVPVTEGTSIRFIVNIIENSGTKTNCIAMFFNDMPGINSAGANVNKVISLNKVGTTTSLGLQDNQFKVPTGAKYALFIVSCSEPNTTYKFDNFMLLENNEDDFISYFEGLKSVGQGDKIGVLTYPTNNENLITSDVTLHEGYYISWGTGELVSWVASSEKYYATDYIEVEPNTEYIFANINKNIAYYDANKTFIPMPLSEGYNEKNCTYFYNTSPSNAKYVRLSIKSIYIGKPYMAKGKYICDNKVISTTLRSLPNGVKDTIEKRGNKYVKMQRCGEIVLNGSENITIHTTYDVNVFNISITLNTTSSEILSDKYKKITSSGKEEGILIDYPNSRFRVTTDKFNTIDEFKTYLQSNPITVVYELATPQIIELPNFNPQTFEGGNTLIVNSGVIQCDASFDVCEGIRSELDTVKDKVSSIYDTVVEGIRETRHYPKLQKGWVTYSADYTPTFVKFGNLVTFNMRIKGGQWSSATIIVDNLPEEFRVKAGHAQVFPAIDLTKDKTYNAIIYKEGHIKLYGVDEEPTGGLAIMGTYYVN